MKTEVQKLQERINVKFKNQDTIIQAVTHRSYLNEHSEFHLGHNERLEFLGDAVLELVVTEYLYLNYENPEGELTNWRAALVNSNMLAKLARKIDIEKCLLLSKGESRDTGKARQYILANAYEALLGAIYIDQGWDVSKEFIENHIISELPQIISKKLYVDPKTKFQEISQEKVGITPSYKVLEESGPDHDKNFKVGVYLSKDLVATGAGSSKQEAQVNAAREAIKVKKFD